MTPLHLLQSPQERYTKLASSAHSFIITQFGLSAFTAQPGGRYQAKTFNFYIFPEPSEQYNKRFVCEAGAISFLTKQGFDFNKVFYHGVPFMPATSRDARLQVRAGKAAVLAAAMPCRTHMVADAAVMSLPVAQDAPAILF